MTKLCPRGKAAAKRKFKVYPSAYANAYASKICAGKIKDPSGVKRKDFRGSKTEGGLMEATSRLKRQGLKFGSEKKVGRPISRRPQQGRKGKKGIDTFIVLDDKFIKDPNKIMEKIIITDPEKKAKGGRAGLKGGGICKRGMNRKAVGKNS